MHKFEELAESKSGSCLVIGNGPSLRNIPLDFLSKYPSFGTNKIFLLSGFCPTYYVVVNPLVVAQSIHMVKAAVSEEKFLPDFYDHPYHKLHSIQYPLFSFNPAKYIYEGYTVTFVCLQLAFYMGFTTVLLVGVDHKYVYDGQPNEEHTLTGEDLNHFDSTYFSGHAWNNPDLAHSEDAYATAEVIFRANGRRIVNLTENTLLEVFEKGSIDEW